MATVEIPDELYERIKALAALEQFPWRIEERGMLIPGASIVHVEPDGAELYIAQGVNPE